MNEEQKKRGFFTKRSNKLLVLIIAAFLGLAAATVGAMEYTSTTGFCNSCHIMNPSYGAWASSGHKGVHCYDCHMDDGAINYLKAKVNGLKEVYLVVTNSVTTPGTDEKAWDRCQKCHAKLLGPSSQQTDSFEHYKHISKGLDCKQCHGNLVHGKENKDFKQLCVDCHKNKVATPTSHSTPEFKVTHGQAFLKNNNSCELCHSEGQGKEMCQKCHGLAMPHPNQFVDKHVAEIKSANATSANANTAGTEVCLKCHLAKPDDLPRKAQSCQACHGITLPHPQDFLSGHGKAVQDQGDKTCLNCHKDQPAGQTRLAKSCDSCHGIKMPHPQNFQSQHAADVKTNGSQTCLNCHKNDGKPRKTKTCEQCHGLTMPHPAGYKGQHTSVVAAQGTQVCLNCHKKDGLARKAITCQSCHGVPMPHAKGYMTQHSADAKAKGTVCLNCHSGAAGLKAPTCKSCHGG